MKKLLLALLLITNAFHASAEVPVIDFAAIAQAIIQVALASNQVDIARQILARNGDPAAILISSLSQTLSQLGQHGVARTLPDIQNNITGQSGQSSDGNGLYTPVNPDITLANGESITRPTEPYRKHEALQQTIVDYNAVITDTQPRRDSLRDAQVQTIAQLKSATTDAEVQKLKAVLAGTGQCFEHSQCRALRSGREGRHPEGGQRS
jgi:hypothetical protein